MINNSDDPRKFLSIPMAIALSQEWVSLFYIYILTILSFRENNVRAI
jgi:hypothetical protein